MTVMPTVRLFYGLITIPKTSTYFNYNYSYDFKPNWLKDARKQQTNNTESG